MVNSKVRTTTNYIKKLRYEAWKSKMNWNENELEREIDSQEALPEMIQDYEARMVIVGTDVVSLYPNMEVNKVIENVKEAVLRSTMIFEEFDYMEGARYLALNWSADECRKSRLRRILPIRRGRRGTRPGMRGSGPRGKTKGDQEQWAFPDIVLEEWEKNNHIKIF